ncbi:phospholipase D-like domain-containing protein [Halostreptopolyspora alba]|uniref:Phosphatidylserine/phosphatidylglycerophosphate/ cardiolipin synthase family protein n=1 Tax=Halostreptopolyspora alba TaxID=2487137 RepID=A0A3N0ED25_9ACTN|nr:phosphatidylserine/phosphatidylglycerophosphate/cardiolipin synthase family protein [Nocardiopsaceae bacterium YIM 96095]
MARGGTIVRALKRALLVLLMVHVTAIAVLVGIDSWRKRLRPLRTRFPRTEPQVSEVAGTTVTTYTYGEDVYRDMLEAIRGARRRVLFESFIVKGDVVGQRFKSALIEAAERGVKVYVLYDGFANLVVPHSFFRFPPSVHVLRYPAFRPGLLLLNIRKAGRDHRKILTVDGEVGFVGGYNVGEMYAIRWRDTHLRMAGPAVWELENAFVDFWNANRHSDQPQLGHIGSAPWNAHVRAYRNVPEQLIFPIRAMYLEAIDRARERICVTQAYFMPDQEIVDNLVAAAKRGVEVNVLVPERSNHVIADWLARHRFSALLHGGVRLWLFQGAMVHAKAATVDGKWSTVGTANLDRLSLMGNYEINVEIIDTGVATHLERAFNNDCANARLLTEEEWRRRPIWARLGELALLPLRPVL